MIQTQLQLMVVCYVIEGHYYKGVQVTSIYSIYFYNRDDPICQDDKHSIATCNHILWCDKSFSKRELGHTYAIYFHSGIMLALQWDAVKVGPSGNKYATVKVNVPTGRYKLKLISINGFISCIGSSYFDYFNNFGCMELNGTNEIRMVITDKNNTAILPGANGYSHDGEISKSIFVTFNDPIDLEFGQTLRIWHKDDLEDHSEADNLGLTFIRVLALRID